VKPKRSSSDPSATDRGRGDRHSSRHFGRQQGIRTAVATAFLGAPWQIYEVHTTRAILENLPKKYQRDTPDRLGEAYGNEERLQALADEFNGEGYRKAANTIERFLPELLNYTTFPKPPQKRIWTTNGMEWSNKKLKRRTSTIGAFPNEDCSFDWRGDPHGYQ